MKRRKLVGLLGLLLAGVAVFLALGVWQVERRTWKLDLIDKVDTRIHAAPAAMPDSAHWPSINAGDDAYRHVAVSGRFLTGKDTLVKAVTALGGGFWLLTPLRADDGSTVLINRGFVAGDRAGRATNAPSGEIRLTGLLRITEPGGAFLRANDPAANRWYSRDVKAIAAARGLTAVAPFFIDADGGPSAASEPIGGLTVVSFPNNHLIYALTWFALAAMLVGWTAKVVRQEWFSPEKRLNTVRQRRFFTNLSSRLTRRDACDARPDLKSSV